MINDRRRAVRAAAFELLAIPYCPTVPTAAQARFLLDLAPDAVLVRRLDGSIAF